jgi:hypothetical protein
MVLFAMKARRSCRYFRHFRDALPANGPNTLPYQGLQRKIRSKL